MTGSKGDFLAFLKRVQVGKIAWGNNLPLSNNAANAHILCPRLPLSNTHPRESPIYAHLETWRIIRPLKLA